MILYILTQKVSVLVGLVMLAVNFTTANPMASAFARNRQKEVRRLHRSSLLLVGTSSLAVAVVIVLVREPLNSYAGVEPASLQLSLGLVSAQVFFSLGAVSSLLLTMCNDEVFLLGMQSTITVSGLAAFVALSTTTTFDNATLTLTCAYALLAVILTVRAMRVVSQMNGDKNQSLVGRESENVEVRSGANEV